MTASERPKLGAILLAAGGSARLGRPKQLVKFEGETLLRRAARSLADSIYFPVVVVLGAESETASAELEGLPIYTVVNENWTTGLSSSMRAGIGRMLELEPGVDGVIITLCDQPRVTTDLLNGFALNFDKANVPVISALYNGILGVPALFAKDLFDELLSLKGDQGARQVIRDRDDVCTIEMPEAAMDIDTEADAALFGITNSE